MRPLHPQTLLWLKADPLPAALQPVKDAVIPSGGATTGELRGLRMLCRQVPEWRAGKGLDYPLPCSSDSMVTATLAGVVRGRWDLAAFAEKLTQRQLRALGSYRNRDRSYGFPKEITFQRVLAHADAEALESVLLPWEDRMLGHDSCGAGTLVAIDGKAQRGSIQHVENEQKSPTRQRAEPARRTRDGHRRRRTKEQREPRARVLADKLDPAGWQVRTLTTASAPSGAVYAGWTPRLKPSIALPRAR